MRFGVVGGVIIHAKRYLVIAIIIAELEIIILNKPTKNL